MSSFGATGDLAARVALQSIGLDPNKDVTIVTLGVDTLRHAALVAGTVQATHMPVDWPCHQCGKDSKERRTGPADGARVSAGDASVKE